MCAHCESMRHNTVCVIVSTIMAGDMHSNLVAYFVMRSRFGAVAFFHVSAHFLCGVISVVFAFPKGTGQCLHVTTCCVVAWFVHASEPHMINRSSGGVRKQSTIESFLCLMSAHAAAAHSYYNGAVCVCVLCFGGS